jgi:hypothetical protein
VVDSDALERELAERAGGADAEVRMEDLDDVQCDSSDDDNDGNDDVCDNMTRATNGGLAGDTSSSNVATEAAAIKSGSKKLERVVERFRSFVDTKSDVDGVCFPQLSRTPSIFLIFEYLHSAFKCIAKTNLRFIATMTVLEKIVMTIVRARLI